MAQTLVRVVAPHFVAGFVIDGDRVVSCAPILRSSIAGKTADQIRQVCKVKGWRASVVQT